MWKRLTGPIFHSFLGAVVENCQGKKESLSPHSLVNISPRESMPMPTHRVLGAISRHGGAIPVPQSPASITMEISGAIAGSHSLSVPPQRLLGDTQMHTHPGWEPRKVWNILIHFLLKHSGKKGSLNQGNVSPRLLTPCKFRDLVRERGDLCLTGTVHTPHT